MKRLKLSKSTNIYKGKIVTLKKDVLVDKKGKEIIRERIAHRKVAAVVPFLKPDQIVLIKHYRYPIAKYIWEIPAGILEGNENIKKCAQRELKEEIGFEALKMEPLLKFFPTPGISDEEIHVFKASNLRKCTQKLDEDEYIKEIRAFSMQEAKNMIQNEEIVDGKTWIGLLAVMNCLGF